MRTMIVVVMAMLASTVVVQAERLRSPDGNTIRDVPEQSMEFAIKDGWTRIRRIHMRTPEGTHVLVDEDGVEGATARGYWKMTESEISAIQMKEIDRAVEALHNQKTPLELEEEQQKDTEDTARIERWLIAIGAGLLGMGCLYVFRRTAALKKQRRG